MTKNILLRTNFLVCAVIVIGFLLTAVLGYQANYSSSLENIEQVSSLASEGIYYQMSSTFTKPVNVSLTMANDSLLKEYLAGEQSHLNDKNYIKTIQKYLNTYREKYNYDSVFLVSRATGRYYNFNGLDRVLEPNNPENVWYYDFLENSAEHTMNVDNDEVVGAGNEITVFVNCKIRDDKGQITGVIGVGLRIDYLQKLFKDYEKEFNVNVSLIDDSGDISISPEHSGYEKVDFFETENYGSKIEKQILDWDEAEKSDNFWASTKDGPEKENYVVVRYLPELSWHLIVERNTGTLLQSLQRQMIQSVLIIAVIIAVILYVITRVIRSFNRRIVSLTRAVEQERRTMFEEATEQLFENIYELDITNNRPANQATKKYFESLGAPPDTPYDKSLRIVAEKQIKEDFRQGYIDTFSPENVLKAFEAGKDTLRYDFMISNGGDYYWMRITARLIRWESDNSVHMLTYRQNIDAEKRREARMIELAQTDEMTGLFSKTATRRHIEYILETAPDRQYAFIILDIDNFKQANDRFGHAFGDSVIIEFSKIIRSCFRSEDIIGRIGGDEFVVFIPIPDREWVGRKLQELSTSLRTVYKEGEKIWQMSASIGASFAPEDGSDFDTLYRNADCALYETKARKRGSYTVYCGPNEK